jgi:hypothetical protein
MGAFYSLRLARRSPSICRNKMRKNVLRCQLEARMESARRAPRGTSARGSFWKRAQKYKPDNQGTFDLDL